MTAEFKPSKERAEYFYQAACMVRGLIATEREVTPEQIVAFLEDQAQANDVLAKRSEGRENSRATLKSTDLTIAISATEHSAVQDAVAEVVTALIAQDYTRLRVDATREPGIRTYILTFTQPQEN